MNDAVLVCECERPSDILHDAERLANAERAGATKSDIDGLAIDVGHHEVRKSVDFTRFEYRNDVRVLQPRERKDFATKSFRADARG